MPGAPLVPGAPLAPPSPDDPGSSLTLVVRAEPGRLDGEALARSLEAALGAEVRPVLVPGTTSASTSASPRLELPRLEVEVREGRLILFYSGRAGELRRETEAPSSSEELLTVTTLLGASLVRDEAGALLALLEVEEPAPEEEPPASAEENSAPSAPAGEAQGEQRAAPAPPGEENSEARADEAPADEAPVDERPLVPFGLDLFPGVGVSSVFGGRERRNVSLGLVADLYGALEGYALGLLGSFGGEVRGVQHSLGFAIAERVEGAQIGLVNVAAEGVGGAQIGSVNIAGGPVRGPQIGAINIGESADVGIGLINIYTRGRTHLELAGDSSGFFRASVKHGAGPFHSVYELGVNPFYGETALLLGLGFGGRVTISELAYLDLDLVARWSIDTRWDPRASFINEARVLVGLRPIEGLAVVFGLGLDVHTTDDEATPLYALALGTVFADGTRMWPSLILGLSFF